MSGSESAAGAGGVGFSWLISLGNILTIVISASAVIAAIFQLVRYLRKTVTSEIVGFKEDVKLDLTHIKGQIETNKILTEKSIQNNTERMEEIRWLIGQIEKRIEEIRQDLGKRMDQRTEEIRALTEKLDRLREEYYGLEKELTKIQAAEAQEREDRQETLRDKEQKGHQQGKNPAYW